MDVTKRRFLLGASSLVGAPALLGASSLLGSSLLTSQTAFAQEGGAARRNVPHKTATTKILFKSPSGWPNALADAPEGLWVAEQKPRGATEKRYGQTYPADATENIWLMDLNGKVLKTLVTDGRNTSGLGFDGKYLWSCALSTGAEDGVYQYDLNGKLVSHRQAPLGPSDDGGGIHGAFWQDGKLWIFANRLNAMVRIVPSTWTADFVIPVSGLSPRYHGIAWDNGSILIITGNATAGYKDAKFGLERYDAASGRLTEIIDFAPGSADPHGLAVHNGKIISCDAGIHPGWPVGDSPTWGSIFEVDIA
jgi:hypothetical protein